MRKEYPLTLGRVLLALAIGALIGASVSTIEYLINLYQVNGSEHFKEWALSKGLRIFYPTYVVWLIFLSVFGGPTWLFLHIKEKTHWIYAIASGFLIPFAVIFAMGTGYFTGKTGYNYSYYGSGGQQWVDGVITAFGWEMAFYSALQYAIVGVCISAVIWYIAYGIRNGKKQSLCSLMEKNAEN